MTGVRYFSVCAIGLALGLTACQNVARVVQDTADHGLVTADHDVAADRGLVPDLGGAIVADRRPDGSCYSDEEKRADALARLRTQLMVTGLTCPTWLQREQLYSEYQDFMLLHADRIRSSQRTIGGFLGRYSRGRNARLYDTYATELANDEFILVTQVGAERYCLARGTAFDAALQYDDPGLNRYLEQRVTELGLRYPDC